MSSIEDGYCFPLPRHKKPQAIPEEINKPELKLAMAKLLPENIQIDCEDTFYWREGVRSRENTCCILETEWLFVMQMVEEKLNETQYRRYETLLDETVVESHQEESEHYRDYTTTSATFNQRATAMRNLKGIKFS